jgi:hypothetical protein
MHHRRALLLLSALALTLSAGLATILVTGAIADTGLLPPEIAQKFADEKAAREARQQAEADRVHALPPVIKVAPPAVPRATAEPLPTGLFESSDPVLAKAGYRIANHWRGVLGSDYVDLYAGARESDLAQGVVVFQLTDRADLNNPRTNTIATPSRHGLVSITTIQGGDISVRAADGTTFVFNLSTGRFK